MWWGMSNGGGLGPQVRYSGTTVVLFGVPRNVRSKQVQGPPQGPREPTPPRYSRSVLGSRTNEAPAFGRPGICRAAPLRAVAVKWRSPRRTLCGVLRACFAP